MDLFHFEELLQENKLRNLNDSFIVQFCQFIVQYKPNQPIPDNIYPEIKEIYNYMDKINDPNYNSDDELMREIR